MFNVKSQGDYDALSWENRLRYGAMNPDSEYVKNEKKRTEQALYTKPTDQAKNWWAQNQFIASGGNPEDAILGNFDKSAYSWNPGKAVRSEMNARGISNDRIGYRNGNVTLDGKDFLTPDAVADGRSYASDEVLKNAFRSYNETNGVVPARDYINKKNPAVKVGWDAELGQVLVGSQRLTPDYITPDGVAQVSKARVDAALSKESADTGIFSRMDIFNQNNDRWEKRIERLYDRVENPEPFSYNAEDDPLYQDFKRQWMKQSQAQYDDTIAKLNTQSGGAPSLGAMAAAWNMLQDSNGQLDSYKQQFRQQAYNEWVDAYNRDVQRLETALGMRDGELERAYKINDDMISDAYFRPQWDSQMRSDALNQEAAAESLWQSRQMFPLQYEQAVLDLTQNKALSPYVVQQMMQAVQMGELELESAQLQNLITQAKLYGLNFNSGRSGGDSSGGDGKVAEPKEPAEPVVSRAYSEAVSQIGNIINEEGRPRGIALQNALLYIIRNKNLTVEESKAILGNPELFGATQEELDAAYARIG